MDTVNDQRFPSNFHDQGWDIFKDLGYPNEKGKNDQNMTQAPKTGVVVGCQFKLYNAGEVKAGQQNIIDVVMNPQTDAQKQQRCPVRMVKIRAFVHVPSYHSTKKGIPNPGEKNES
jgi:hypothetical protein